MRPVLYYTSPLYAYAYAYAICVATAVMFCGPWMLGIKSSTLCLAFSPVPALHRQPTPGHFVSSSSFAASFAVGRLGSLSKRSKTDDSTNKLYGIRDFIRNRFRGGSESESESESQSEVSKNNAVDILVKSATTTTPTTTTFIAASTTPPPTMKRVSPPSQSTERGKSYCTVFQTVPSKVLGFTQTPQQQQRQLLPIDSIGVS